MKKIFKGFMVLTILFMILIAGCDLFPKPDPEDKVPEKYKGFYNYPVGRKDPAGTLKITNSVAQPVLLFTDSVAPANYIGTVDSLSTVKVRLPEQKFYTIVAVIKKTWEERGDQAEYFSDLAYYHNTQPYAMSVRPSDLYGAGKWIITNKTNYWVSFKKSDQSGTIYAVAAPQALRVVVPIPLDTTFDYIPHFYKELKYDGKVIALVESDDMSAADTVVTSNAQPTFNTEIGRDINPPGTSIKPAIFVRNSCDKTVRIYSGRNNQLSPSGMPGIDFALASGGTVMITGLEDGNNVNDINFDSTAWNERVYVTNNVPMVKDKVYRITLNGRPGVAYSTSVEEVDASTYFN
jgi:hypothetical protein